MVLLSLAILATVTKVVRYFRRPKSVDPDDSSDLEQSLDSSSTTFAQADTIRRRTSSLTAGGGSSRGASPLGMLMPRGGFWRDARARTPPLRQILAFLKRPRGLLTVILLVSFILWYTVLSGTADDVNRYDHKGMSLHSHELTEVRRKDFIAGDPQRRQWT